MYRRFGYISRLLIKLSFVPVFAVVGRTFWVQSFLFESVWAASNTDRYHDHNIERVAMSVPEHAK